MTGTQFSFSAIAGDQSPAVTSIPEPAAFSPGEDSGRMEPGRGRQQKRSRSNPTRTPSAHRRVYAGTRYFDHRGRAQGRRGFRKNAGHEKRSRSNPILHPVCPPQGLCGDQVFRPPGWGAGSTGLPMPAGPIRTAPVPRRCGPDGPHLRQSVFSFGPRTTRFLFGKTKRKWGCILRETPAAHQPRRKRKDLKIGPVWVPLFFLSSIE